MTKLPHRFGFANGIAISPGGRLLFIATFPDGITTLDLLANISRPIARPAGHCYHPGAMMAVQAGYMVPRLGAHGIHRAKVLERRHPRFDGITTGVFVGDKFYNMANIQDTPAS